MPSPCAAETASGSPSPRPWNSAASGTSERESTLLAATTTGRFERRSRSAISASPGRSPARASTTSTRDLRVGQRGARLVADRAGDRVEVERVHAAGVDEREAAAVPLAGDLLAIARDAGALVHDGLARAAEAVDQRALADVRVADDRDLHARLRAGGAASRAARRSASTTWSSVSALVSTDTASGGGGQRRALALAVARVALVLLGEHGVDGCPSGPRGAARARRAIGRQEDLERRPRARRRCRCRGPRRPSRRRRAARAGARPSPRAPRGRPRRARRPRSPRARGSPP